MNPNKKYPPLRPLTSEEQKIVQSNLGLARKLANRMARSISRRYYQKDSPGIRGMLYDEIIGHAMMGLCIAIQRFDPTKGCMFSTFAYHTIRGQVGEAARQIMFRYGPNDPAINAPEKRVEMLGECWHHHSKDGHHQDRFEVFDGRQPYRDNCYLPQGILDALDFHLDPRRAQAIKHRIIDGWTLSQIGKEMNLSKERVRQLLKTAVAALKGNPTFMEKLDLYTSDHRDEFSINDFDRLIPVRIA